MTIDQQLRDRFDRLTDGTIPKPDLATTIAAGRRRRRRRVTSYAVGSLAVLAVAAGAIAAPHLGRSPDPVSTAAAPAPEDDSYVPGTTIDTDLAAAVAAADPALPDPSDVFPSDWSRDTPLPDEDFANATEWQLVYDLSPHSQLLVYVSKPIPGEDGPTSCSDGGDRVVKPSDGTVQVDTPARSCHASQTPAGPLVTSSFPLGEPTSEFWFTSLLTSTDDRVVNVIEQVSAATADSAQHRRVLDDSRTEAIARTADLDFPDPVAPPPAP